MSEQGNPREHRLTVGLVLGGGGFVGGAWLTGALLGLEDVTGWNPARADRLLGTSAGAMIASLVASGAAAEDVPSLFYGEGLEALRDGPEKVARPRGAIFRWHSRPRPTLGSTRLAWEVIRHPRRVPPMMAIAALLPRGFVSTEPIKDMVRQVVPDGWSPHQGLGVVGCDLESGDRVVFGWEGAPRPGLADAVAASCAIPGFYHPEEIEGRLYVDGGCWSPSNLDLLVDAGLDLVICFNPTSSRAVGDRWHHRLRNAFRGASGRLLGREARLLRQAGSEVVLVQPGVEDAQAMGSNYMRVTGLQAITDTARATVAQYLRDEHPEVIARLRDRRPAEESLPEGRLARLWRRVRGEAKPARGIQPA